MSIARIAWFALAAAVGLPPAGRAQQPPPPSGTRIIINGVEVPYNLQSMLFTRRARLGVTVALQAHANDSAGATLSAVTPGGPAFRAGLQTGDIIVRLNGTAVTSGPRPEGAEPDQSLPGLRLIEIASQLEPNVPVTIEFKRGDQRRTVSLTTGNEPILLGELLEGERRGFFTGQFDTARIMMVERAREPFTGGRIQLTALGRFSDLELAPLNPDLASYFGATDGVLVVRAGERSNLALKGGDVLLTIDGRAVTTPAMALRILRSYEPGEAIVFELLRNRQRQTIRTTIGRDE